MKKLSLVCGMMFIALCSTKVVAQDATVASQRAQNIFIELGGQGLTLTANYDTRFTNKRDGIGGRIGIGHISSDGSSVTTVPLSLNYLLGKERRYFEVGLGATYLTATADGSFLDFGGDDYDDETGNTVIGTMSFAYRLQPMDSGFSFRAGITPIFGKDFFIPYYGGISLGYTF